MLTATQFIWQNFVALSEFKIILPLLKAKLFEWGLSKDPLSVHRLLWFSQGNGLCPSKIKAFQREKNAFSLGKKAFFRRAKALVQSFSCFSILHSWVICFVSNAGTFVHNHSEHPTNQKLAIDNTRLTKGRKRNQVALSGAQKVRWSKKTHVNCQFLKKSVQPSWNGKVLAARKSAGSKKISHNSERAICLHAFEVLVIKITKNTRIL